MQEVLRKIIILQVRVAYCDHSEQRVKTSLNFLPFGYGECVDAVELVEKLLESLIELHSTSATFRQVFKSQSSTQFLIDAHKSFVNTLLLAHEIQTPTIRILEKLAHLSLSVALDTAVGSDQKQEVSISRYLRF